MFYVYDDTTQVVSLLNKLIFKLEISVWDALEEAFLGHANIQLPQLVNNISQHRKSVKVALKPRGREVQLYLEFSQVRDTLWGIYLSLDMLHFTFSILPTAAKNLEKFPNLIDQLFVKK
jgi:hypothetical protein